MMSTLTIHCQWIDETARDGTGLLPSYAKAKKMKSLTLHTHGCLRTSLRNCFSSSFSRMQQLLSGMVSIFGTGNCFDNVCGASAAEYSVPICTESTSMAEIVFIMFLMTKLTFLTLPPQKIYPLIYPLINVYTYVAKVLAGFRIMPFANLYASL